MSADGHIAYHDGQIGPLFDWMAGGDVEWKLSESDEHAMRTTQASKERRARHLRWGRPFFGAMEHGDNVTLGNPSRVAQGNRVTHLLYDVEY